MTLTPEERERLKQEVVACLSGEPEVRRVVLFGSFVTSPAVAGEFLKEVERGEVAYVR